MRTRLSGLPRIFQSLRGIDSTQSGMESGIFSPAYHTKFHSRTKIAPEAHICSGASVRRRCYYQCPCRFWDGDPDFFHVVRLWHRFSMPWRCFFGCRRCSVWSVIALVVRSCWFVVAWVAIGEEWGQCAHGPQFWDFDFYGKTYQSLREAKIANFRFRYEKVLQLWSFVEIT